MDCPPPRLSIIIPTLNEAPLIRKTLTCLQALRAAGHEVIVVDGGSADQTLELSRDLVDQALTCAPGRARQMNYGARLASGEILVFLHADTSLPEDAWAQLHKAFLRPRFVWGRFDVSFEPRSLSLDAIAFFMNWRSRLTSIATGDQVMFVHRSIFEQVRGFPEIALMEDIALSKRLKRVGRARCLPVTVTTSARRWLDQGVIRTVFLMWRLRLQFAFGGDPEQLSRRYYRT